jgi:hypothetical protein
MFRLIKLGIYAFIGYALYELYQGMMHQQGGGGMSRAFGGSGGESAGAESFGDTGQNITGAGRGRSEATLDTSGGSTRH